MLISLQSANRKTRDFLRMFHDSGRYTSFLPQTTTTPSAMPDCGRNTPTLIRRDLTAWLRKACSMSSKCNARSSSWTEAHKAYGKQEKSSEEFVRSINRLNPSLVIELSATPNRRKSNLLVDVSGVDLKSEEMIKLPIQVTSRTKVQWQDTLGKAHTQLELLENEARSLEHSEGRYIRPIAVVRVENIGAKLRNRDTVHAEDVREHLTQKLGVPAEAVRVKSSELDDLGNEDLLDKTSQVRWIITKEALREGWDCSFAYVLVMLDNTKANTAITQMVGRVLRQPEARRTGRDALRPMLRFLSRTRCGCCGTARGKRPPTGGDDRPGARRSQHGTAYFETSYAPAGGKSIATEIYFCQKCCTRMGRVVGSIWTTSSTSPRSSIGTA